MPLASALSMLVRRVLVLFLCGASAANASEKPKDVLFLVVDDLRSELGCFGCDYMQTPHLDNLAKDAMVLDAMYVQLAVCAPSRTAFLTSRRPDTSRVWSITKEQYWRKSGGNFTTLPQYFKESGYLTWGVGKIFHPGAPSGGGKELKMSWSPESLPYVEEFTEPDGSTIYKSGPAILPWNNSDEEMGEGKLAAHACEVLDTIAQNRKKGLDSRPFFLAVGFHRPHIPFSAPQKYFDMYDLNLPLAPNLNLPVDMPSIASNDIWNQYWRKFPDVKKIPVSPDFPHDNSTCPLEWQRKLRQAYRAAVSFTDRNVGTVLTKLKDLGLYDSTIISFISDHGYQLGDNNQWAKHTNFEHATRTPAMFRLPPAHFPAFRPGRTAALLEEVDLFPTLVDVALGRQLPLCPKSLSMDRKTERCTEGSSFAPVLENPKAQWKLGAFSQYERNMGTPNAIMGYTIRVDGWRYTEWASFDASFNNTGPDWSNLHGSELYQHKPIGADCTWNFEHINLANNVQYKRRVSHLQALLRSGWRQALPTVSSSLDVVVPIVKLSPASKGHPVNAALFGVGDDWTVGHSSLKNNATADGLRALRVGATRFPGGAVSNFFNLTSSEIVHNCSHAACAGKTNWCAIGESVLAAGPDAYSAETFFRHVASACAEQQPVIDLNVLHFNDSSQVDAILATPGGHLVTNWELGNEYFFDGEYGCYFPGTTALEHSQGYGKRSLSLINYIRAKANRSSRIAAVANVNRLVARDGSFGDWNDGIISSGLIDAVDAVTLHDYIMHETQVTNGVPRDQWATTLAAYGEKNVIKAADGVPKTFGASKRIWMTEYGIFNEVFSKSDFFASINHGGVKAMYVLGYILGAVSHADIFEMLHYYSWGGQGLAGNIVGMVQWANDSQQELLQMDAVGQVFAHVADVALRDSQAMHSVAQTIVAGSLPMIPDSKVLQGFSCLQSAAFSRKGGGTAYVIINRCNQTIGVNVDLHTLSVSALTATANIELHATVYPAGVDAPKGFAPIPPPGAPLPFTSPLKPQQSCSCGQCNMGKCAQAVCVGPFHCSGCTEQGISWQGLDPLASLPGMSITILEVMFPQLVLI